MKRSDYDRDENGIPCTCAEDRAGGDPELHADMCPWAIANMPEDEEKEA